MTNPEIDMELTFEADADGERLDAFVVEKLEQCEKSIEPYSRSRIQKLIRDGLIVVNSEIKKKNYVLSKGDVVHVALPVDNIEITGDQSVEFSILYEDDHIIMVNKPAGVITHPTPQSSTGTLVNGLLSKGIDLAPAGGKYRPGVVHRLDKEASGLITLAKTDTAYYGMGELFKLREIDKLYRAIVIGNMREIKDSFNWRIGRHPSNRSKMAVVQKGGKEAQTDYKVVERFDGFDSLRIRIHTGRTHQIRVHLSHSGRAILNDHIYGGLKINHHVRELAQKGVNAEIIARLMNELKPILSDYPGMFLHAERLVFRHPVTMKEMKIDAPLPDEFERVLVLLRDIFSAENL